MQALEALLFAIATGGALLVASAGHSRIKARVAPRARWRTARARVVSARIDELSVASAVTFRPRVRYRFQIGPSHYEGSRILLHGRGDFQDRDAAERWLFRHAPGRAVTAWYDPRRPEDCALLLNDRSLRSRSATAIAGALIFAAGVGGLFCDIR